MQIIISNSSPTPIYEQIKDEIIAQIRNGDLKENESLPSIRVLAKDIKISIMTIKKAYDELEKDGYITQVQGKGTYIKKQNQELMIENAKLEIEDYLGKVLEIARNYNIDTKEIITLIKILDGSDNE